MVDFFFKRRKVVVDCFTHLPEAITYAPIAPASKMYPDWWKGMPGTYQDGVLSHSTLKRCVGLINQFQVGAMVPLWCDTTFEIGGIGSGWSRWHFADNASSAVTHSEDQRGIFLPDSDYAHLKIISPWEFDTKEAVNFALVAPLWNQATNEYLMPPAVVDFKYQHGTNINLFFKRGVNTSIVRISHGMPMIHVIPLTEREVEFRCHLISPEKMRAIEGLSHAVKYSGNYRMHKKAVQAHEAAGRCPFREVLGEKT